MPESVRVIVFTPKNIALVIQHVHVTQINFMLFRPQYEIGDDELAQELKLIRKFVANNHLYDDTFSPNFSSEIANASKNIVLYNKNEEIILIINCNINYNTNNPIVHLLVANISQALTFALEVLIYKVLNNGLDGIVYHVRINNSKMLNLSSKGGITEIPCTQNNHIESSSAT